MPAALSVEHLALQWAGTSARNAILVLTYPLERCAPRRGPQPQNLRRRVALWGLNPQEPSTVGAQVQRLLAGDASHEWAGHAVVWGAPHWPFLAIVLDAQQDVDANQMHAHWDGLVQRLPHLPGVLWQDTVREPFSTRLRHELTPEAPSLPRASLLESLRPWLPQAHATQAAWELRHALHAGAAVARQRI